MTLAGMLRKLYSGNLLANNSPLPTSSEAFLLLTPSLTHKTYEDRLVKVWRHS
jgi:hypothetical protein